MPPPHFGLVQLLALVVAADSEGLSKKLNQFLLPLWIFGRWESSNLLLFSIFYQPGLSAGFLVCMPSFSSPGSRLRLRSSRSQYPLPSNCTRFFLLFTIFFYLAFWNITWTSTFCHSFKRFLVKKQNGHFRKLCNNYTVTGEFLLWIVLEHILSNVPEANVPFDQNIKI